MATWRLACIFLMQSWYFKGGSMTEEIDPSLARTAAYPDG